MLTQGAALEDIEFPNVESLIAILQDCRAKKNLAFAHRVHARICCYGLDRHAGLGNYHVPMFVDCGSMPDAQQAFNRSISLNEHSWTSLIQGFIDCGEPHHALRLHQKMQEGGVHPSRYTLVTLLKACSELQCLERGHEIHTEVTMKGFESDPFISSTLVDMYVKCDSVSEAQEVFDDLPVRNVVSWTTLIAGYAEHMLAEDALDCFEQMQLDGESPDAVTFVCSLKACGNLGSIDRGREIHSRIVQRGFERDRFICSSLMGMYVSCASLAEARGLFDELVDRDVISWNTLIAGYVDQVLGDEALKCLEQMHLEGVCPNAVTLVCGLKACGSIGAIDEVQNLHAEIVRKGFETDIFIGSTLVDMYAKCGLLAEAEEVFDKLPVRPVVSWTALIAGYTEHGLGEDGLKRMEQMHVEGVCPDAVTLVCGLKACESPEAIERGREIHADIVMKGFGRDPFVGSSLVILYIRCGSFAEALQVFDKLLVPDVVSWTALIEGYVEHEMGEEVLSCLKQMQLLGVSPNCVTYICSLKASVILGSIERGHEIHAEIVKRGFENDSFVGNSLVDMYAKCGLLSEARKVFDKLPVQNVVSWNTLLAGYAEQLLCEEAVHCFQQMQLDGVTPDAVSWNALIWGFADRGEVEKACKLYAQLQEQCLLPDNLTFRSILRVSGHTGVIENGKKIHAQVNRVSTPEATEGSLASALIDMYGKCGSMDQSQQVFDAIPTRGILVWNALIAGYVRQGESVPVFHLFDRMKEQSVQPDGVTFLNILSVCNHVGLVDRGLKYFEAMSKDYGITPIIYHHACIVDLLGRAGKLDEAVVMMEKMPSKPNLVAWRTVLGACQKWRSNVEFGRSAFEWATRLDEMQASLDICLDVQYLYESLHGFINKH